MIKKVKKHFFGAMKEHISYPIKCIKDITKNIH